MLSAYPGIGAIYVVVARSNDRFQNLTPYSVYVPSFSYGCTDFAEGGCEMIGKCMHVLFLTFNPASGQFIIGPTTYIFGLPCELWIRSYPFLWSVTGMVLKLSLPFRWLVLTDTMCTIADGWRIPMFLWTSVLQDWNVFRWIIQRCHYNIHAASFDNLCW